MAFKKFAILALTGTVLGDSMESAMPMSSSVAMTVATETSAQSEATSSPPSISFNSSSLLLITDPSSSAAIEDYTTTTMPADMTTAMPTGDSMTAMSTPVSDDPAMTSMISMSTSMTDMPSTLLTSVSMNMPMGTGGMVMPNATATGKPVTGSANGISGVSIGLFVASMLLGVLVQL